jgi:hypothetical protein
VKVLTYFEPLKGDGFAQEIDLLRVMVDSWRAAGFDVLVIGERDYRRHELADNLTWMPTCNPEDYEMACWRRWLAAAAVTGFGEERVLCLDLDVINCGLRPDDLKDTAFRGRLTALHPALTPAVIASKGQLDRWAKLCVGPCKPAYYDGVEHHSDMILAQQHPEIWDRLDVVRDFAGWGDVAPAVHLSHYSTRGSNRLALAKDVAKLGLSRLESATSRGSTAASVGCR